MNSPRQLVKPIHAILFLPFLTITPLVTPSAAAMPQLLSERNSTATASLAGNGDSVSPWISPDGRYVLFSSTANNLVTHDNGYPGLDAFLHDRTSDTTVLASMNWADAGGGNKDSLGLQVSMNGRYVLLQSDASDLVVGDTNEATDIYIRDLALGINTLVSTAAGGGWGNGPSYDAVMTPDGRWVAFVSEAANLVPGDTNGIPDLFLRDLVLGTTARVTAGATGASAVVSSPVITPFGRYVAFYSSAKGLVDGVPATSRGEIYLFDSVLDKLAWVSTNAAATAQTLFGLMDMPSYHPALSDDGRYVAFKTGWTNGTVSPPGGGTVATLLFVYDSVLETSTTVATNAFTPWFNSDDVYGPEMTPDGRFVAYVERESSGTENISSVRLWDRSTATNVVVSVDQDGLWPTNTSSHTPRVSEGGRYVTFLSDATNLVSNIISNGFHIYRRDLLDSTTELVDVDTSGIGSSDQFGVTPSMNADGSGLAYSSLDGSLVNGDDNKKLDVFLWEAAAGTNKLLSGHDPLALSISGNAPSSVGRASLSDSGTVAFASFASDLVGNDFNHDGDVFVHDSMGNSNVLVSVGLDGNAGSGGGSFAPSISSDGRYVVFLSWATNLVAGDTDDSSDVFRRDLLTGTTILVSTNFNGVNMSGLDCKLPLVSDDGRFVAYFGYTNFLRSSWALFWRDLLIGTTRVISTTLPPMRSPTMSSDGQRLAYPGSSSSFYVWDAETNANIYTRLDAYLDSAAISPQGNRLLFVSSTNLYIRDLPGAADQLLYPSSIPIIGSEQWSGDGRYVAFVTKESLVAGDDNEAEDVYLRDLQTGTLTLLSVNDIGTASAAGDSDWPVFSRDGRFVAFRSFAPDIAPGVTTPPSLVLFDRVTGSNSVVVTGTETTGSRSWLAHCALNTNGTWLAFQSWDSGVVEGDLNRTGDAFTSVVDAPPLTDSDGDGVPDWWTMQYFGHPTGEAADLSRAEDDADFDGLSNSDEFVAGTDPLDPGSRLAVDIDRTPTPGWVTLTWDARPGRTYQVQSVINVTNPVWQAIPGGTAVVGNQGYLELENAGSTRYFRVEGSQ